MRRGRKAFVALAVCGLGACGSSSQGKPPMPIDQVEAAVYNQYAFSVLQTVVNQVTCSFAGGNRYRCSVLYKTAGALPIEQDQSGVAVVSSGAVTFTPGQ
jgi:hypothetical protein